MLWYGNICVSYYKVRIPRTMRLYSYFMILGLLPIFLGTWRVKQQLPYLVRTWFPELEKTPASVPQTAHLSGIHQNWSCTKLEFGPRKTMASHGFPQLFPVSKRRRCQVCLCHAGAAKGSPWLGRFFTAAFWFRWGVEAARDNFSSGTMCLYIIDHVSAQ